jgi:CDGSH-type Zn-finger protein
MSENLAVTILPNGPIKVEGAGSLTFCGDSLAAEGDLYLCRCGESANAPFCDGTHAKTGFDGGCEDRPNKEIRTWEGKSLKTFFNPNACMHVFYCKPLADLRAQELQGNAVAADEIIRVVGLCPSGALSYERENGSSEPASQVAGATIQIVEGGEIRVQGEFHINASLLARMEGDKATLCRCGLSKNKPWCDGRHRGKKGFR